ncbi:nitroreductase family protein [Thermotoga caldifontis]|uniref:nitroreductase family protein n=1 Tax=Thermotoga caldifontis TaxID=1508419 RepID=UPI0005978282|nr:nitroreductase family protein [Thermotoga caldifontis]
MSIIYLRRSVRKYQNKDVGDEIVTELLRAAMHAPSAGNAQPWHFIVIRSEEGKQRIAEVHPYARMVLQAPVAILVCADPSLEIYKGFWVQDCSAATMNILLRAVELGLGAVWCGVYPNEERVEAFRKIFGLPGHVVPFSIVPVGYPAETPNPVDRFKPERIHYEAW